MAALFHLVDPQVWAATRDDYRPPSLGREGFVHLSFADQVADTANRHYANAPALVVLEVDPARLSAEVKLEDSYGAGRSFPHLYGPLPVSAVVAVHDLPRGADGRFSFDPSGRA